MIASTEFEYRHRYALHGLIYLIGFMAPWEKAWFRFGQDTVWLKLAGWMLKLGFGFAGSANAVLIGAILLAFTGGLLRMWGAAYLGASVVQRGSMAADRVVADGPYRYVRNPLYLGTILHTFAMVVLMRPAAAVLTVVLISIYQLRLIAREEPFLSRSLGPAYDEYCRRAPRLLPRLRSNVSHGGAAPRWGQAMLSEVYQVGTGVAFATLGWKYDALLVLQGLLVALGVGIVARAFIPHRG